MVLNYATVIEIGYKNKSKLKIPFLSFVKQYLADAMLRNREMNEKEKVMIYKCILKIKNKQDLPTQNLFEIFDIIHTRSIIADNTNIYESAI
jgi:hypothetical protein